jgi:hypothetical protein
VVEDNGPTVGRRHNDLRLVGTGAWAGIRLESTIEELVKVAELFQGHQDFRHVQLVEIDEVLDLRCRGWIIIFTTLLDTERTEHTAN